nr:DUF2851 family protein [Chitinophagaceae bacterium]
AHHIEQTENHWEEVCWRLVSSYFGGPVNKVSFSQIAESLPLRIIGKHKNVLVQIEALLLGQSGLLHKDFKDEYPKMLFREYQFLQKKYGLQVINKPPLFLRMRPTDFPTIRLAQLSALLHQSSHLFSKLLEAKDLKDAKKLFDVQANDYWNDHYKPDIPSESSPKRTGQALIDRIIINAVIPVLFSYGHRQMNDEVRDKALQWLEQMPAESNRIIRIFSDLGKKPANASETQALLTLKQDYCDAKRCLSCAVGNHLLRQTINPAIDK